jgi:hypothetical protein
MTQASNQSQFEAVIAKIGGTVQAPPSNIATTASAGVFKLQEHELPSVRFGNQAGASQPNQDSTQS